MAYPGQQYRQDHGHQQGYGGPPPGQYGPPQGSPYGPPQSYGGSPPGGSPYGPPQGGGYGGPPPGGYGGHTSPYGPPPGAPPHSGSPSPYGPPHGGSHGGSSSPYGPPSGGYNQPSGAPQGNNPYGPPPSQGDYNAGGRSSGGGSSQWAPPTGPPPQISDNTRPFSGHYSGGPPPQNFQQATHNQNFRPPQPGANDPYFQYSNCSGRRKALCIGINYTGTSAALKGCHNDAINVQRFLSERYNYKQEDIVVLLDTPNANARQIPTRANIISAMHWLVAGAQPNDSLFFHYSGHGGQVKDETGMEDDGYAETIFPVDFKQAGQIVDDEMNYIMVRPLPAGCRLTALYDSCHSGTALDLPYVYSTEGTIKTPNLLKQAGSGLQSSATSYLRGDVGGALSGLFKLGKAAMNGGGNEADRRAKAELTFPCDAIQWSGCKDSQTSADATEAGKATGAMSWSYLTALSENPNQSYQSLLIHIRKLLEGRYQQKPQMSCSHPIDVTLPYIQ